MTTALEDARPAYGEYRPGRHQHHGIRCAVTRAAGMVWCPADDYAFLCEHISTFTLMSDRDLNRPLPDGVAFSGAYFAMPPSQRMFQKVHGRADTYRRRPVTGRVHVHPLRASQDIGVRLFIVAHELGHARDVLDAGIASGDVEHYVSDTTGFEATADRWASKWGFQRPSEDRWWPVLLIPDTRVKAAK